jgi:hypothetical protein
MQAIQLHFIEPHYDSTEAKIERLKEDLGKMQRRIFADLSSMKKDVDFLTEQMENMVDVLGLLSGKLPVAN